MSEFRKPNPLYKPSTLVYIGLTLYMLTAFIYFVFERKNQPETVNYSLKEKYMVSQIKGLEAIKKYHSVESEFEELKGKLKAIPLNDQVDLSLHFAVLYDYFGLKSRSFHRDELDPDDEALQSLVESILYSKGISADSNPELLIHNGFKEEWYRQRLLYKYYKTVGDHEKLEELKNQISESQSKMRILLFIRVMAMIVFVIVGFIFIVLAIRHWKEDRRLAPPISFSGVAHPVLDAYGLFIITFSLTMTVDIVMVYAMAIGMDYSLFLLDSTDWLLGRSIGHTVASAIIELIVIRLLILKQESIGLKDFFRQILPISTLKVSFRHVILGVQTYAVAVPIIILVSLISTYFIDQNPLESSPIFTLLIDGDSPFTFISVFVMAIILAPIFEEVLFRGLLFRLLQSKWSTELAALVTSVVFGAIHFSLYAFLPITVFGMVLAWGYQKSNSLITPIVAHALWNATTLLSIYLFL